MKRLSLHVWLVAALALAVVVPAAVAAVAWLEAGSWQKDRQAAREQRAIDAINAIERSTPDGLKRLALRLSEIGVEAQVATPDPKAGPLQTSGFQTRMEDPGRGEIVKLAP